MGRAERSELLALRHEPVRAFSHLRAILGKLRSGRYILQLPFEHRGWLECGGALILE